jgi:hypothetical protein
MNHSIVTEFQDDIELSYPPHNSFISSPTTHQPDAYLNSLAAKTLHLKAAIRTNRPLIEQLRAQRRFLKKVCEKQQQKLEGAKVELIRSEFEKAIGELRREKHKLHSLIDVVHEESALRTRGFAEAKLHIARNGAELTNVLEELRRENAAHEAVVADRAKAIELRSAQTALLSDEIRGKENLKRKYRETVNEVQVLEELIKR